MAFSILGIFSVMLEILRPLLAVILAVLVIDVALLLHLTRAGGLTNRGPATRAACLLGAVAALATLLLLPYFTRSSHASLSGWLDWLALGAGSLGVGVASAMLAWPALQWLLGRRLA